jgi:hypothetical protein
MEESCILCGCKVHRSGEYATKTLTGRSHATFHHYVAERFFGRSQNRKGTLHVPIFTSCPWDLEKKGEIYCYECHEELIHNPVFTKNDIGKFAALIKSRKLNEIDKQEDMDKIAGRIKLLNEIIAAGLNVLSTGNDN